MLLATKCYVIDGHEYFRIHLKRKEADRLGLQREDKLLVEIKEIVRKEADKEKRYQVKLVEVIP